MAVSAPSKIGAPQLRPDFISGARITLLSLPFVPNQVSFAIFTSFFQSVSATNSSRFPATFEADARDPPLRRVAGSLPASCTALSATTSLSNGTPVT